jgi:uncharacterized protein YutD
MIKKQGLGEVSSILDFIKGLWGQVLRIKGWLEERKRKKKYKKVDKDVKDGNIEELNRIHRG